MPIRSKPQIDPLKTHPDRSTSLTFWNPSTGWVIALARVLWEPSMENNSNFGELADVPSFPLFYNTVDCYLFLAY